MCKPYHRIPVRTRVKISHSKTHKDQILKWIVNDIEDANNQSPAVCAKLIVWIIIWAERFDIKEEDIAMLLESPHRHDVTCCVCGEQMFYWTGNKEQFKAVMKHLLHCKDHKRID